MSKEKRAVQCVPVRACAARGVRECRDCGTVRAHMCGANVRSAEDVQTAIRSERDAECVRVRACGGDSSYTK